MTIRNCLVARNTGVGGGHGGGGGIYVWGSGPVIESCTIVSNVVTTADKGGGISHRSGSATVRNCIVYFNTAGGIADDYALATTYATYSCCPDATTGTGNITADPLLADLLGGDYRLMALSPCIDAGTNQAWMGAATDLGGNRRTVSDVVDMGASESVVQLQGTLFIFR